MAVSYETIIKYLDAIEANGNLSVDGSPHGRFWKDAAGNNLPLATFKSLVVPGVKCNGASVPTFDTSHPDQSPLYLILLGPWCSKPQMPKTGPFITDSGYSVQIDGVAVSGDQIKKDFLEWIEAEFPPGPSSKGD